MKTKNGKPPVMAGGIAYPLIHPEIFYRLQPEIVEACDEMERNGVKTPTKEIIEQMVTRIRENVSKKYPDLAQYAQEYERNLPVASIQSTDMFGIQVASQGVFFDLIAFLLLGEFFGRRRRRRIIRRRF
jgi:hypothetical protein